MYAGGKVPWDPDYRGGKLLEEEAYARNWGEVEAVEEMGWDYIWLGGGHFSKQASMDPQVLMLAAAVASRTRRIKIGSSIHRPVLKQPGETASARALPHERQKQGDQDDFDKPLLTDAAPHAHAQHKAAGTQPAEERRHA